ncbi:helix-turn-helix transcriptional regulator [Virgibacillus xinjiangensis]|uniref:Helix-turn-helix transcriptional regulator n=1 Tax=Virgibacillus xinjiangensis TaxID=393090 RepID=A0ABV7CZD6_9BACI
MKLDVEDFIKKSRLIHSVTKIDTRLFDSSGLSITKLVNHTLPVVVDHLHEETAFLCDKLRKQPVHTYYHHINTYNLEYIAVGLWKRGVFHGILLTGPFISGLSILDHMQDVISSNNLPIGQRKTLEEFYQSLPLLSDLELKNTGELIVNLLAHHQVDAHYMEPDTAKPVLTPDRLQVDIEENKHIIEKRYKVQNELMHHITKGDKEAVHRVYSQFSDIMNFSGRIPGNPLRASKNIAFVTNTLYRVAAERAGVHPVYLHNMSERFAILVEKVTTMQSLEKLMAMMADEYCDLVQQFSTGGYSRIVRQAIDIIQLNLGEKLSLDGIAAQLFVTPSHLSRRFKAETGWSVTTFINRKRVEEAKWYLQRDTISITDIALMVGFSDVNYFSKVFKRHIGKTPTQYIREKE